MMKKIVILTMMVFLVGLIITPLVNAAYHQVYAWDDETCAWREASHVEAEMYSEESDGDVYQWQSAEGADPGTTPYQEPEPHAPIQFHITNHAHVFPWIDAEITETHLTWDIFQPGDYMAKTFILSFMANCPVQVHLGSGTWEIPATFVGGKENGHIEMDEFTKPATGPVADVEIGKKVRQYSLLCKDEEVSGTPPDEIDVRYWWYIARGSMPDTTYISDEEFADMPPKEDWRRAERLNCKSITIRDSKKLHEGGVHLVFFEDLEVEACDSEGKYVDLFAITITPDP